ncbi:MAG: transcription termination/antitermination protein NusG [Bacteriovoracaceae bacterium]|jgi:transcriptional antiterminator NusG|nr:transcription termination/antitermination protein NusG [Bacteriovoracaceae bacterium]
MTEEAKNEEMNEVETTAESSEEAVEDNGLAKGDSPDFKWFVANVLSNYEARVTKTLKERILNHNMSEYFAEILVPEETVVTSVNGKKRNIKKKFFPGYMLIKMIMNEKTWHLVKNTDKITGFVGGTPDKPQPISDEEAAYMLGQTQDGFKKPRSTASYSAGDSVKVIEGPFASFVGTVEAVAANGKLKVNVSIFGRPTPVELDDTQVEKA